MTPLRVQVETARFREGTDTLTGAFVQAVTLAMRSAVKAAETSAKGSSRFKDRTGETRGSIEGEVQSYRGGFVRAGGAMKFLEWGTRAHVIHGRPVLRFVVNGQVMFRRMVHHPGTKARHIMGEARERGEIALDYGVELFVNEAIRRAR